MLMLVGFQLQDGRGRRMSVANNSATAAMAAVLKVMVVFDFIILFPHSTINKMSCIRRMYYAVNEGAGRTVLPNVMALFAATDILNIFLYFYTF